jgi:hypothetical protein
MDPGSSLRVVSLSMCLKSAHAALNTKNFLLTAESVASLATVASPISEDVVML